LGGVYEGVAAAEEVELVVVVDATLEVEVLDADEVVEDEDDEDEATDEDDELGVELELLAIEAGADTAWNKVILYDPPLNISCGLRKREDSKTHQA
jgi:hypothetical protein